MYNYVGFKHGHLVEKGMHICLLWVLLKRSLKKIDPKDSYPKKEVIVLSWLCFYISIANGCLTEFRLFTRWSEVSWDNLDLRKGSCNEYYSIY